MASVTLKFPVWDWICVVLVVVNVDIVLWKCKNLRWYKVFGMIQRCKDAVICKKLMVHQYDGVRSRVDS